MKYTGLTFFLLFLVNIANADTLYICQMEDKHRTVQVAYTGEGDVPCEVRYTKEGVTEVLWRASNETGYCEKKAKEFVEKQKGWGWQCHDSGLTSEE